MPTSTSVAPSRAPSKKRLWDATQRFRVKARTLAPVDEVVLTDEDGEVCRIGVMRKTVARYETAVNSGAGTTERPTPVMEIALPRIRWLER